MRFPVFLCFQKSNVFVSCGSTDVADPCQFRHIQLLALVGGIVPKEGGGNVGSAHLRTTDLLSLLQLPHLTIDVLLALVGGASCVSVCHSPVFFVLLSEPLPLLNIFIYFSAAKGGFCGIPQKLSASIPLISTKKNDRGFDLGRSFCCGTVDFIGPLTSCILNPSAVSAEAGHSVTDALSGSIPLISTRGKRQDLLLSFLFCSPKRCPLLNIFI